MFTEGLSNKLLCCKHKDDIKQQDVLLVRVFGEKTDLIIDRNAELRNMELMSEQGCAKPPCGRFRNGIVYGFVPGECLDITSVREPHMARLIAREMVRMNAIDPQGGCSGDRTASVFTVLHKYMDLAPEQFPDPDMQKRYVSEVASKQVLYTEIQTLQQHLVQLNSPVVFCHNDLLLNNLVYNKEEDRVYFIDFEYGSMNYEAYDIGNHFCEFAGVDEMDYAALYPDKDYQLNWLRTFLEEKSTFHGGDSAAVTEQDVLTLYKQVNKFALLAHIFWGVWGLIQARYSTIDFDYLGYAAKRFNEYYKRKAEFLDL